MAGQFPKFSDEVYWIQNPTSSDRKFLLPTAETALVNLHRDEILSADELPKKYIAYTPCYRREGWFVPQRGARHDSRPSVQ